MIGTCRFPHDSQIGGTSIVAQNENAGNNFTVESCTIIQDFLTDELTNLRKRERYAFWFRGYPVKDWLQIEGGYFSRLVGTPSVEESWYQNKLAS